jgi:hypothetical protein
MHTMTLDGVIAELRSRSQAVPLPPRLPTSAEIAEVEARLGVTFPADYAKFLAEASDVTLGTLEPATIANPNAHTHLCSVVSSARKCGVPVHLLPICEDNGDFYCLEPPGSVLFWSHNGAGLERSPSLAAWLEQVWLGERA